MVNLNELSGCEAVPLAIFLDSGSRNIWSQRGNRLKTAIEGSTGTCHSKFRRLVQESRAALSQQRDDDESHLIKVRTGHSQDKRG